LADPLDNASQGLRTEWIEQPKYRAIGVIRIDRIADPYFRRRPSTA
jgi:hypothetical protein